MSLTAENGEELGTVNLPGASTGRVTLTALPVAYQQRNLVVVVFQLPTTKWVPLNY